MLSAPSQASHSGGQAPSLADDAARQQLLARQVATELAQSESNAHAVRETDPKGALAMLEDARKKVEAAGLDPPSAIHAPPRRPAIGETKQMIEQNRPQIELAEKNNRIREEVEREQRMKVEVQEKIAMLVDKFNRLMDEQRFEEAEVVAKQAAELDPNNPVVVQVLWDASSSTAIMGQGHPRPEGRRVRRRVGQRRTSRQFPSTTSIRLVFPDAKEWDEPDARAGRSTPATAGASGRSARSKSRRSCARPCRRCNSPTPR